MQNTPRLNCQTLVGNIKKTKSLCPLEIMNKFKRKDESEIKKIKSK